MSSNPYEFASLTPRESNISLTVKLAPLSQYQQLAATWQKLHQQSADQCFLSWHWIGTWLKQVSPHVNCLLLTVDETSTQNTTNTVGLAILVKRTTGRGLLKKEQYFVHRTGDESFDQIWIENNNLLIKSGMEQPVTAAFWAYVHQHFTGRWQINIGLSHKNDSLQHRNACSPALHRELIDEPGYRITLSGESIDAYIQRLSKNSRYQLRRAIKAFNRVNGDFVVATSPRHQQELLQQGQAWHQQKWRNTPTPSGFDNPHFVDFHQQLIRNGSCTLVAGLYLQQKLEGVMYCLTDSTSVNFYLNALNPQVDNKLKTGWLLHYKMIEWLMEQPYQYYDFLAGDARYKQSLGTEQTRYYYDVYDAPTWLNRLEYAARKVKSRLPSK